MSLHQGTEYKYVGRYQVPVYLSIYGCLLQIYISRDSYPVSWYHTPVLVHATFLLISFPVFFQRVSSSVLFLFTSNVIYRVGGRICTVFV